MPEGRKARLKIPVPGGRTAEHLVDFDRIMNGEYELLINERGWSGIKPIKAAGFHLTPTSNLLPGIEPLVTVCEELTAEHREGLTAVFGPDGEELASLLIDALPIGDMLRALTNGDVEDAETTLREGLTTYYYNCLRVAAVYQESRAADRVIKAAQQVAESALDLHDTALMNWGNAALEIIKIVDELTELKTTLSEVRTRINQFGETASVIAEQHPDFARVLQNLRSANQNLTDYWFQHEDDDNLTTDGEKQANIAAFRSIIEHYQTQPETLGNAYVALHEDLQAQYSSWVRQCEDLTARYAQAVKIIFEVKQHVPTDLQAATQHLGLTENELETADTLVADPVLTPAMFKVDLGNLLRLVSSFLSGVKTPVLPQSFVKAAAQFETYAARIEAKWLESEMSDAVTDEETESEPASEEVDEQVVSEVVPAATQVSVSDERYRQLYEQALCVAQVLTNKPQTFAITSAKALLSILRHLNRCSEDEVDEYRNQLDDQIRSSAEVAQQKGLTHRWKSSRKNWAGYNNDANRFLCKLTPVGAKRLGVLALQQKHSLCDEAEIRTALKAKQAESREQYEQGRAGESD